MTHYSFPMHYSEFMTPTEYMLGMEQTRGRTEMFG